MKSDVILLNYILAFYARTAAVALPLDGFYPFDIETDDQVSLTVAGAASWIPLTKGFPFYNCSNSGGLYINNNGVISLNEPVATVENVEHDVRDLALATPLIAPFWVPAGIQKPFGKVLFRIANDDGSGSWVLHRATTDVSKHFPEQESFSARQIVIATWYRVGIPGALDHDNHKYNTFQAVLITDWIQSYVIFNYKDIQWSPETGSGENNQPGLGDSLVVVGFYSETRGQYFRFEGSGSDAITNITLGSNVGIPGKYIFRVSDVDIAEPEEGTPEKTEALSQNCSCNLEHVSRDFVCNSETIECACATGWTGATCDDDVNECESGLFCSQENSQCLNEIGSYKCVCEEGFASDNDGNCVAVADKGNVVAVAVLSTILGIMSAAMGIVIYIWCRRNGRQQETALYLTPVDETHTTQETTVPPLPAIPENMEGEEEASVSGTYEDIDQSPIRSSPYDFTETSSARSSVRNRVFGLYNSRMWPSNGSLSGCSEDSSTSSSYSRIGNGVKKLLTPLAMPCDGYIPARIPSPAFRSRGNDALRLLEEPAYPKGDEENSDNPTKVTVAVIPKVYLHLDFQLLSHA